MTEWMTGVSQAEPSLQPASWQAPLQASSTHVVGVSGLYPSHTFDKGYSGFWASLAAGADLPIQVPHGRWDLEQYYAPEAHGDLTMYVRHAAFVDNLDTFDAGLFR